MDQDPVIGSPVKIKAAAKETPSLALALFPQPQLLVASDLWLAPDGGASALPQDLHQEIEEGEARTAANPHGSPHSN